MDSSEVLLILLTIISAVNFLFLIFLYISFRKSVSNEREALRTHKDLALAINEHLRKIAEKRLLAQIEFYRQNLSKQVEEHFKRIGKIESDHAKKLSDFLNSQEKALIANFQKLINSKTAAFEHDLKEYKEARMAEIDAKVGEIAQELAREVVNRSISVDEHEDLVRMALERAKKEGLFK